MSQSKRKPHLSLLYAVLFEKGRLGDICLLLVLLVRKITLDKRVRGRPQGFGNSFQVCYLKTLQGTSFVFDEELCVDEIIKSMLQFDFLKKATTILLFLIKPTKIIGGRWLVFNIYC